MADTLRQVAVEILFEADERPLEKLKETFGELAKHIGIAGLTMGGIFEGLIKTVEHTSEVAEEIETIAKRVGLGVEELQKFQYAAKKLGQVTSDELTVGLQYFSRTLGDATVGSQTARQAMLRAGVDFSKFGGRVPTVGEALLLFSERLKAIQNPAVRLSVAADVLGARNQKLVSAFSSGARVMAEMGDEASKLGAILSEEAIESGVEFNHKIGALKSTINGIALAIGGALLPAVQELVVGFAKFLTANRGELIKSIAETFKALAMYVRWTAQFMQQLFTATNGFVRLVGGWKTIVRLAAAFAAIWIGGSILSSIGTFTSSIIAMGRAIQAVTSYSVLMNSVMLIGDGIAALIPIALGAGVVALGLIMEDLYQFATGGDSVIGRLVEGFKNLFPNLTGAFDGVMKGLDPLFDIINRLIEGTTTWKTLIMDVVGLITNLATMPIRGALGLFGAGLNAVGLDGAGNAVSRAQDMMTYSPLSGGPVASPASVASTTNTSAPRMDAQLNFQIGPGTSADQVARGAQTGLDQAFQGMVRGSARNVVSSGHQ